MNDPFELTVGEIEALSRASAALSDPTRVRLVMLLCEGEQGLGELSRRFAVSQPTVSHHLACLRRAGLLVKRREGKSAFYALHERFQANGDGCELRVADAPGIRILIEEDLRQAE